MHSTTKLTAGAHLRSVRPSSNLHRSTLLRMENLRSLTNERGATRLPALRMDQGRMLWHGGTVRLLAVNTLDQGTKWRFMSRTGI